MGKTVLVTGGAGYIGSHTCLALLSCGWKIIIIDNLSNSCLETIRRLERITACTIPFFQGDIQDSVALTDIFERYPIEAVLHFAALKSVGESVKKPLLYYQHNLGGLFTLCQVMAEQKVKTLVFSSSATVYGKPNQLPITEESSLTPCNPYGHSKLWGEQLLKDVIAADPDWKVACLRYFNPIGAHESGWIGEHPQGEPNNLMPLIAQVAAGKRQKLRILGQHYPTPDGTGVRDYIHVMDLAHGHVAALDYLVKTGKTCTVNLGSGHGTSVLELLRAFEAASSRSIPYEFAAARVGDVAACYANPSHAQKLLGWRAELDIARMCADTWRWQSMNPNGYESI